MRLRRHVNLIWGRFDFIFYILKDVLHRVGGTACLARRRISSILRGGGNLVPRARAFKVSGDLSIPHYMVHYMSPVHNVSPYMTYLPASLVLTKRNAASGDVIGAEVSGRRTSKVCSRDV